MASNEAPDPAADEDSRTLAVMRVLLNRTHLATPGQVPDAVQQAVAELGWSAVIYLVDYEQRLLVPAPVTGVPQRTAQAVETTLAGRCFRTVEPMRSTSGQPGIWLPLLDGVDRLGVLELVVPEGTDMDTAVFAERCELFAHLAGHMVVAKSPYGEGLTRLRHQRPRSVASELLWQLLPPLTFGCEGLVVSGLLEPCYEVAADAFDYSVLDDVAHLAVFDATGHDLPGTLLSAVALSAYRTSCRAEQDLHECARTLDEHVGAQGGAERFVTGVLSELDLRTGRLRYLNAGHSAPLLMRAGKVVKELTGGHRIMFGLGDSDDGASVSVGEEWLEPEDWVVFYTDGITEARSPDGAFFGLEGLIDHLQRAAAAGQPTPETVRRIVHDVLEHQNGVLQDDATLLIAQWASGKEQEMASLTPGFVAPQDLSPTRGHGLDVPRR
ncbi:PP2C family protein-serine/threonine phosphatase [Kineococcus sp. SYSU DK018]|uniref:PP2C family protein-serine/threonine phosphatase n=1 Tax=Kineococcus sp. SYSU DK018 TaxID=3383139 RepID=UPI003D7F17E2